MDYRECKLLIGKHRVNQLTVIGVAAEVVWKEAFRERRGLNNVQLADVASVTLRNVSRCIGKSWLLSGGEFPCVITRSKRNRRLVAQIEDASGRHCAY